MDASNPPEAHQPPSSSQSSFESLDLKAAMVRLERSLQERQDQIDKLRESLEVHRNDVDGGLRDVPVLKVGAYTGASKSGVDEDLDTNILKTILSLAPPPPHSPTTTSHLTNLHQIHTSLTKTLTTLQTTLTSTLTSISNLEQKWQDQTSQPDSPYTLKETSWRNWPTHNIISKSEYHYDFFISYRVASEFALAREVRLRLVARGFKVFLDQECLKDGEDWQQGFTKGLQRSRIVLLLISIPCIQRMLQSDQKIDNVLLEWETSICASIYGFCRVVPVYLGTGTLNVSTYPKARATSTTTPTVCNQSAHTTLTLLQTLPTRHSLPTSHRGIPEPVITSLASELIQFASDHDTKAQRRAELMFADMAHLETFGCGGRVLEGWKSSVLELGKVAVRDLERVRCLLERNRWWEEFVVTENEDIEMLLEVLKMIAVKKPKRLVIRRKVIAAKEMTKIQDVLQGCESIVTAGFIDSELPENVVAYLSSLPNLTTLILTACLSPILKGPLDVLSTFLKSSKIIHLDVKKTFGKKYFTEFFKAGVRLEDLNNGYEDKCPGNAKWILAAIQNLQPVTLDFSDCRFQANSTKVWEAMTAGKSITTLYLNDFPPEEADLSKLFSTLHNLPLINLEIGFGATEFDYKLTTKPASDWIRFLKVFMTATKTLTRFIIQPTIEDPECMLPIIEAISENRTITELAIKDRFRAVGRNLSTMKQLKSLTLTAMGLKDDEDGQKLLKSIFTLPELQSLDLGRNKLGHDVVEWIVDGVKSAGLQSLSLGGNAIKDTALMKLVHELLQLQSLKFLNLSDIVISETSFRVILEAKRDRRDLRIIFDWSEDINQIVKCDHLLPELHSLNADEDHNVEPSKALSEIILFGDETPSRDLKPAELSNPETLTQTLQTKILETSLKIPQAQSTLSHHTEILSNMQNLDTIFRRSPTELTLAEFAATWPGICRGDSVVFLDRIVEGVDGISVKDLAVVRELALRIGGWVGPEHRLWIKDEDEEDEDVFNGKPDGNEGDENEDDIEGSIEDDSEDDEDDDVDDKDDDEEDKDMDEDNEEDVEGGDDSGGDRSGDEDDEENETIEVDGALESDNEDTSEAEVGEEDEEDDNQETNESEDESEYEASILDDESTTGEDATNPAKLSVASWSYPVVKVISFALINLQSINLCIQVLDTPRNIVKDVTRRPFPSVIVIILSESILQDISTSEDTFWATINCWDYLMRLSEENLAMILPLFVATNSDADSIIGKIITKLRHTLYLFGSKYSTTAVHGLNSKERSLSRAFDVINRLFKLQGVTIEKLQQSPGISAKIIAVAKVQARKNAKLNLSGIGKNSFRNLIEVGGKTGIFRLGNEEKINDLLAEDLAPIIPLSFFKYFIGTFDIDERVTNAEIIVAEALSRSKALETIELDGYCVGEAGGPTDKAITIIAKSMTTKNLTKLILKWNMTSGKAAPVLAAAISNHPTLKVLELHGFSEHYMEEICTGLLRNNTVSSLSFIGLRFNSFIHKTSKCFATDEGVEGLCRLISSHTTITSLDLSQNIFSNSQLRNLGTSISRNTSLKRLVISDCEFTDASLAVLIDTLSSNKSLESIDISNNDFNRQSVAAFKQWFETASQLTAIKFGPSLFWEHELSPEDKTVLIPLLELLQEQRMLKSLEISGMSFSDEKQFDALLSLLRCNSFKHFSLLTCRLSDEHGAKMFKTLSESRTVESITCQASELGHKSAKKMASWVKSNDKNLKEVYLDSTHEQSSDFADLVRSSLKHNNTIKKFEGSCVSSTYGEPKRVANRLRANTILADSVANMHDWIWAIKTGFTDARSHLMQIPGFHELVDKNTEAMLFKACKYGDLDFIESHIIPKLGMGSIIKAIHPVSGLTALGYAIKGNQRAVIGFLHKHNADPIAMVNKRGTLPALYMAAGIYGHPETTKLILDLWPQSNPAELVTDISNKQTVLTKLTPLHKAARNGYHVIVRYLLTAMETPHILDDDGSTPLHHAALGDNIVTVSETDPNAQVSSKINHKIVIRLLIESGKIDMNASNKNLRTALDIANDKKQRKLAQLIRKLGGS
ncbi:hypothetical protein HDU97_010297 [Phlyctochytrium planicorne]|nr:hypothetical protein HDU97_010297 [Phlyctochytrium planicorne]